MKERVKTVLNYKKPAFWIVILAVLALIVTAVCFLTDPVTAGEPFGKIYQVEKVVYQNPVLSYYMTEADAPLFQLAEDGELLIQQEPDKWESRGLFTEMDMAEANPADWFFGEELGWEGEEAFQTVLGNIQTAWIAELPDPQRPGYTRVCLLLLLRNNGVLYLGDGYNAGNGPEINWFYRLKDTGLDDSENQDTPFGSHYRVEDTIYLESGVGSYSPSDRFVYSLTTGRGFVEKERMSESGRNLFRFTPAELTQEKLAARMNDEELARDLLANNEMAWEYYGYDYPNPQTEGFLYILQQRDGQILLVTGNNRTGEFRIGYIFRLEKILTDDPFAESGSPYQWTRNIKLDYVQSITVSTHDTDGNRLQTELEDFDRYRFLSVLNGVDQEEITFGKLAGEPYIWAEIVCEGETVELAYDKDAVRITFPESATGRYPGEAGNTWIITNDALASAMYAYNAYSLEDSPFSQPDNAFHWCQRMDYSLTDAFTMASEYVTVENRYEQTYALLLSRAEIESLLDLLKDIPESAFAQAEYPEESSRSIYIQCRDVWSGRSPFVQLHLKDGQVYYTYNSTPEETHQTWKIDSEELAAFISAYFTGDFTGWDQFAPVPYVVGEVTLEAEGAVLVLPKMAAFEYEISEDGIRFKPGDEDGWIRMQFLTEPFVAKCGTGLKTQTGNYDGMEIVRGYYDDAAHWSFVEGTIESDGTKYYLHILNENGASWVEEYDWEINWMIGEWELVSQLSNDRTLQERIVENAYDVNWLYWAPYLESACDETLHFGDNMSPGTAQVTYDGEIYTISDEKGKRTYRYFVSSQANTDDGSYTDYFFLSDDPEMTVGKYLAEGDILPTELVHVDRRSFETAQRYGAVPESMEAILSLKGVWGPGFYCQDSVFHLRYQLAFSSVHHAYELYRVDYHGNLLCDFHVIGIPQSIVELEDGGFAIFAVSEEDGLYLLSCYDEEGELRWRHSFEENGRCYVSALYQRNGDIYCFGEVTPENSSSDIYIWRIGLDGELEEKVKIGGSDFDSVYRVSETKNGFILYGSTQSSDGDLPLSKDGYGTGFRIDVGEDFELGRAKKAEVGYSKIAGYRKGEPVYIDDPILEIGKKDRMPEEVHRGSANIFDWEDGYVVVRTLNYEDYPYGHPLMSSKVYYQQTVLTGYDSKGNPLWQLAGNIYVG